jgi:hypothetical protein
MIMSHVLLALALAGRASAQMAPLRSAADGAAEQVFDGSKRTEGPLEILSEEKGALIKTDKIPAHRECGRTPGRMNDGMTGSSQEDPGLCWNEPARTVETFGDKQKIRVVDRIAFESDSADSGARMGALFGGGLGLLGLFALFAGPIGWGIGAGTVLLGALVGAAAGSAIEKGKARATPDEFERVQNTREVVTTP